METQDTQVLTPSGTTTTISYDPPSTQKLYKGQVLVVKMAINGYQTGDIPSGATVTIALGDGLTLNDATRSLTQKIATTDNKNGTAIFVLNVEPEATELNSTITPTLNGVLHLPRQPYSEQKYTNLAEAVQPPVIGGPTQVFVPVPPNTVPDPLTPSASTYLIKYTATILDSNGDKVPGYIVDWHEMGKSKIGLFTNLVFTYLESNSNTPLKYDRNALNPSIVTDQNDRVYVRTVADGQGVASLYLVARRNNNNGGTASAKISANSSPYQATEAGGFLIGDLNNPTIQVTPQVAGINEKGVLEYDSIIGQNVPVDIQLDKMTADDDIIYTFINSKVGDIFLWKNAGNVDYNSFFPKTSGNSNNQNNKLTFIKGQAIDGSAHTGGVIEFKGTGDRGNAVPPSGTLDKPWLEGHADVINYDTVKDLVLSVQVPLVMRQVDWTAKPTDSIKVSAVLHGYKPGSSTLRTPVTITSAVQSPSSSEITKGFMSISVPATEFLKPEAWGQKDTAPFTEGTCYITYKVTRDAEDTWTSEVLTTVLNTVRET